MVEAARGPSGRPAPASDELRRREAELRREHERLETVIQSLDDALFIVDREGRVTLANAAARELLQGLERGCCGVFPQHCSWRLRGRGGRRPRCCLECLADFRWPAPSCEVAIGARVYDLRPTSLSDRDGREVERIFVGRDVTERRRRAVRQEHQERMSALGEIAAVMAHEVNNPLAAISMFSQMLLDQLEASAPCYTGLEVIHRNTMSCEQTIRSLLELAADSRPVLEDLDVRDLVADVLELLRPVAEQHRIALRIDAGASAGHLRGDEHQLRQALVNLVMNAIHAAMEGEEGEVTVATVDRPRELVIRVRDNGPGILPELRQRIFEPFFTTRPAGEGTGLGLPTARRVVKAHGGRLVLAASSAAGTTFEMILPRRAAVEAAAGEGEP